MSVKGSRAGVQVSPCNMDASWVTRSWWTFSEQGFDDSAGHGIKIGQGDGLQRGTGVGHGRGFRERLPMGDAPPRRSQAKSSSRLLAVRMRSDQRSSVSASAVRTRLRTASPGQRPLCLWVLLPEGLQGPVGNNPHLVCQSHFRTPLNRSRIPAYPSDARFR